VALTLRLLGGLSTVEVARSFLMAGRRDGWTALRDCQAALAMRPLRATRSSQNDTTRST
jgi:hypothetical protein